MDRLEKILGELMGVEYDINALCSVLKALEAHYEAAGTDEVNAVICLVKKYTEVSLNQLASSITELDIFLLDQK